MTDETKPSAQISEADWAAAARVMEKYWGRKDVLAHLIDRAAEEIAAARAEGAAAERRAVVSHLRHYAAMKLPGANDVDRSLAVSFTADHIEAGRHAENDCAEKASEPRS